jgi:CBS-domain-containing membrane protein
VALDRCRACEACAHVSEGALPVLVCALAEKPSASEALAVRRHLTPTVWCIAANARARLASTMPEGQHDAIVVDSSGRAIGLLARDAAATAPDAALADSVMQPAIVTLVDEASVQSAHALLEQGGVKTLPVLSDNKVVGCVCPPDRPRG